MNSSLDRAHYLHGAFHNSERRSDWRFLASLSHADLQIRNRTYAPTFFDYVAEKLVEDVRRLFVRKERNVIANATARNIHIAELTRHDRAVVTLNPETPRLQSGG